MRCSRLSLAACVAVTLFIHGIAVDGVEQPGSVSVNVSDQNALHARRAVDVNQPTHDPCLMKSLAVMMRDAADVRGRSGEISGFIVVSDGRLSVQRWRSSAGVWSERFEGIVPDTAVAVVHTHPAEWDRPSSIDAHEAKRLGLPFFVLSYWRIWVVVPESGRVVEVARPGWWRAAERRGCIAGHVAEHSTEGEEGHSTQ